MKMLLDTNFLITAIGNKIDFINLAEETISENIEWIVPEGVIGELERISKRKGEKIKDKEAANIALQMIKKYDFKTIELNSGRVDREIIRYAKKNPDITIATLDADLRHKIPNKVLIIKNIKKLEVL